jgi:hypothetical protein
MAERLSIPRQIEKVINTDPYARLVFQRVEAEFPHELEDLYACYRNNCRATSSLFTSFLMNELVRSEFLGGRFRKIARRLEEFGFQITELPVEIVGNWRRVTPHRAEWIIRCELASGTKYTYFNTADIVTIAGGPTLVCTSCGRNDRTEILNNERIPDFIGPEESRLCQSCFRLAADAKIRLEQQQLVKRREALDAQPKYVYLIRAESTNRYKVGFTTNVQSRLLGLGTLSPFPLQLIAYRSGTQAVERRLHKALVKYHCHGEWFECHDESHILEVFLAGQKNEVKR